MSENIFEESAKQSKKRLGKPSLVNKPASQKVTNETQTNSEMQKMLGRMQEMREDLEKQLLDLHAKAKAKNLDVERLFGDKYRLPAQHIEAIEQQEKALIAKINEAIPQGSCIKKVAKSKEKLTQERKAKFRGARQKWIPRP